MADPEHKIKDESTSSPRGLKLEFSGLPHSPAEIEGDPEELKQRLLQAHGFYNRVNTLGEIAVQIDAARGHDEILMVLRNEAKWLINYDVMFVGFANRSRSHYTITTLSPIADATDLNGKTLSVHQGKPGWTMINQSPIVMEVTEGPSFVGVVESTLLDLGMKSLMVVPLRTGDETIGSLTFSSALPDVYGEQEVWIGQLLAIHIATAIKNAAILDSAQKRMSQIELVNEIAEKLTSTLELDDLLHAAAETIQKSFNYFDVSIFLVDPVQQDLHLVAHSGSYADFLPEGYRQKLTEGIVGWVACNGERCLLNDVTEDARYLAYEYHSTKSELAVPIRIDAEVVGVLNIEETRAHAFDETDAIVLETLCDQLGSAVKNAKLFEEVRNANAKLTDLDRMKSDFLGIVSHDFRSPLASIILAARALLKRSDSIDQRRLDEYLTIIVDQANRLSMLAEDTLSITKMESGQLNYFYKVVNVERLIKDAAALVHFSRRHSIEFSVEHSVAYIKGDQTKLRQVLQNLLSNAVKYSPRGGKVIVTAADQNDRQVIFSVCDEGMGIPEDQIPRLFQKFSRIDTPEAREIKGSGLGLWICKEIVETHGGTIWVETEYGKGSTFIFSINKGHPDQEG